MRNLAPVFPNTVIHMINTSITTALFCIQMSFSLYLVSNTPCWVAVPLPLSECLPHPKLSQHPVLVFPSSRMPFLSCLGSDSPREPALPLSVPQAIPVSSPYLGPDTSHWATFLHRCLSRPVRVLTSCSGSLVWTATLLYPT